MLTVPVCLSDDQFDVTFIKLAWDPVDCAQEYSLDIDMEQFNTIEESYNMSYNIPATSISVSLVANGGDVLRLAINCSCTCDPDKTTSPGQFSVIDCSYTMYVHVHVCISCGSFVHCVHVGTSIQLGDDACFDVTPTEISCGSSTEIGYTITFIVSLMEYSTVCTCTCTCIHVHCSLFDCFPFAIVLPISTCLQSGIQVFDFAIQTCTHVLYRYTCVYCTCMTS